MPGLGVEDVARLEDQRHHLRIGRIERLPAQQADRLELVGRLPGQAPVQQGAELAPAVEQPSAAGGGRFELEEQARGRVGVVAGPGGGDAGPAVEVVEGMGVERQGPPGVAEEPLAQRGGLVGLPERLLGRRGDDDGVQAGRLGAIGPLELPGEGGRALDQDLLDVIAGPELGRPGVEAALECPGILAGQDQRPGVEPVLERVEFRAILALGGLGPGALASIAAVGLGPLR